MRTPLGIIVAAQVERYEDRILAEIHQAMAQEKAIYSAPIFSRNLLAKFDYTAAMTDDKLQYSVMAENQDKRFPPAFQYQLQINGQPVSQKSASTMAVKLRPIEREPSEGHQFFLKLFVQNKFSSPIRSQTRAVQVMACLVVKDGYETLSHCELMPSSMVLGRGWGSRVALRDDSMWATRW